MCVFLQFKKLFQGVLYFVDLNIIGQGPSILFEELDVHRYGFEALHITDLGQSTD